jgi:hypothetical protein
VTGLTNGTAYTFEVVASNVNGDSLASPASDAVTLVPGNQTITFISTAPTAAIVGGATYTATATSTSLLTVDLTIDGSASAVCSISGSTVSFIGAGSCVIDANQAGNGTYNPAPQVQQTFTVAPATPTITWSDPAGITYGTALGGAQLDATASVPGTFVYSPLGGTVLGAGTHQALSVTFTPTDAVDYTSASKTVYINVTAATPTISFTSTAPSSAVVSGVTYNVTASSPSPATITFSIDSSATSVCSLSGGNVVSFTAVGTCKIDANQAGNSDWNAATQAQQSFTVVMPQVPGAPTGVTGVGLDGAAQISWTAPASNGGSPITSYLATAYLSGIATAHTCSVTAPATSCTVSSLTNHTTYTFKVTATNIAGPGPASSASPNVVPRAGATYFPLTPNRILDTSADLGLSSPLTANVGATFQVTGQFPSDSTRNVPTTATAVTGVLSVSHSTFKGWLALTPVVVNTSITSTLNFPAGDARATGVTVPLGPDGSLGVLYGAPSGNTADVAFDVTGYFVVGTAGATYFALTPNRILDSRPTGSGHTNTGLSSGLTAGTYKTFQVTGRVPKDSTKNVPSSAVAVTGTLTVTGQTKPGYLSLGPDGIDAPSTASLYFPVGDNRATGLTVKLGTGGTLSVTYTAAAGATTNVIFDVTGFFVPGTAGAMYVPLTPYRILDTRSKLGLPGSLRAFRGVTFQVTGRGGVPTAAVAVTGTLTVTNQKALGYLTLTKTATNSPTTSTLNFPKGDNRATGVTVPLGPGGKLGIVYGASPASMTTDAIFDVTGYFVQ